MLGKQGTSYQIWRRYWRDKLEARRDFDALLAEERCTTVVAGYGCRPQDGGA